MIATLQLSNFFLDSLFFESNKFYDPKAKQNRLPGEIGCSLSIGILETEGGVLYRIILEVSIDPAREKPALDPYTIKCKIVGFFILNGTVAEENKDRLLFLNGGTILYGIIRGIIAQNTGNGQFGKYIMPAINLVDVYEKQRKKMATKDKYNLKFRKEKSGKAIKS